MSQSVNTENQITWFEYEHFSDERTRGWLLVDSPINITLIVLAYFLMVWCLPKVMDKRKPFQLKGLLIVYNFLLVILNAHIMGEMLIGMSRRGIGYLCHPSEVDYHPEAMRVANGVWLYFISKSIDLLDTLFFILRKKNDQLSVLHVFHHSTMLHYSWMYVKWFPTGAAIRIQAINSFIHVLMYSYYGLSAIGPQFQKYLWWKKYLTAMQLIQFCISVTFSINSIIKGCNHPAWVDIMNILYMSSFLVLFGKFYRKKYTKNKTQ